MNSQNNTILKSDTLEQAFEKIKVAFDEDRISSNEFIQCYQLHKRTIELENNIMSPNTGKPTIQKSDPLETLDKIKNDIVKAFDSVQLVISTAIRKSNASKSNDPSLSDLLSHAMSASEKDLRKAMIENTDNNIRTAARLELRRRGKI